MDGSIITENLLDNYWCLLTQRYAKNYEVVYEDDSGHEFTVNVCSACNKDDPNNEFHELFWEDVLHG